MAKNLKASLFLSCSFVTVTRLPEKDPDCGYILLSAPHDINSSAVAIEEKWDGDVDGPLCMVVLFPAAIGFLETLFFYLQY